MAETQRSVDNYDVFVSFRGEDTRSGFVSHLYQALKHAGIRVFLDNEELTYGKRLAEELPRAIVNSKIYIPVLSETYASSKWCLRELAEIVRNEQEFEDKEILPVFYRVTSGDVKLKTDVFNKHLSSHKGKESDQTVEEWTKALQCIPERRGFGVPSNSSKGDAEFCQDIVKCVSVMLKVKHKQVPEGLVGMDDIVNKVMKLLDVSSPDLQIIGIHGMGGIGKSTLAKVVYNKLCDSFDCCSFLLNVRESLSGNRDCLELQKKLLKDVSHQGGATDIRDTDDAISTIKRSLERKKVLLVFDDVSDPNQLQMLLGNSHLSFGPGSYIIITTRNDRNIQLKGEGEKVKIYEMEEMKNEDALQLFSRHAFGAIIPPEDYRSLCDDIVSNLTEGLPLSLEVIGSLLYRKTEEAWRITIQKLRQIPHKDIQRKLMVSYEDLSDEAKEIFLDIACFFVDEERTHEMYMWESCQLFPQLSIEELVSMCLVKVKDDKYWMHDHIKDLGRSIIRQEDQQSRFWRKEDGINILSKRQKEDNNIKAIRLLDLEFAEVSKIWNLKPENFPHLDKLRFFQMEVDQNPEYGNVYEKLNVEGTFEFFLPNLRWLSWYNASSNLFKVTKFNLKKLVILDFSYSDIDENWAGWKEIKGLHSLQVIDLTGCDDLTETPDLSQFKSLKRLVLKLCRKLHRINRSIIKLKSLEYLDFTGCSSLEEVPEEVFSLIHLKEIMGNFCSTEDDDDAEVTFVKIPKSVGQLTSLVTLRLNRSEIDALPDDIGKLINLRSLDLSQNEKLQSLPDSIGGMVKLENLLLERCAGLVSLPDSLTSLPKLQRLILSGCCNLESLPDSVGEMVSLKEVDISYTELRKLPRFLSMQTKLVKLDAKWTTELEGMTVLPTSLVELIISSAPLQSVPDISSLTNLTQLKLVTSTRKSEGSESSCEVEPCFDINWMGKLLKLKTMHLSTQGFTTAGSCEFVNHSQLEQLTLQCSVSGTCALENLSSLKEVNMSLYKGTKSLSLASLNNLVQFHLSECEDLAEIRGLGELVSLESLVISYCNSLETLDDLSELKRLTYLEIKECRKLQVIVGVPNLKSLKKLQIYGCESLQSLATHSSGQSSVSLVLRVARIHNCPMLRDIQCLKGLKSRKVEINNCPSLEECPFKVSSKPKLWDIRRLKRSWDDFRVKGCRISKGLSDFSILQNVEKIEMIRCETPIEITGLGELQFLYSLKIKHCHSIQRLNIDGIKSLTNLYIAYCNHLNDIGSFPENILSLRDVMIKSPLLLSKLSGKAGRTVKGMLYKNMIVKGFQIDYEPTLSQDDTDLENDEEDDDDEEEEEEEDEDEHDNEDKKEDDDENGDDADDDDDDDGDGGGGDDEKEEHKESETRPKSEMDMTVLPEDDTDLEDEDDDEEEERHTEAETMPKSAMDITVLPEVMSSAKHDPASVYDQLMNSLLLDDEDSSPASPIDTNEAKAVLKRFLSGGIETLEEEEEEVSTPIMLEAAKALSLANPRDNGFWSHFSSKLQLASSFYKLNTEKVKASEALHARYDALKESSEETTSRYQVLKKKADDIQASKEKMEFEREQLRAQLAEIEEKVCEADKLLEGVGYECGVVVSEMEGQCEALNATRDEVRIKDAEKAISEGWLMSLTTDWIQWRTYLD